MMVREVFVTAKNQEEAVKRGLELLGIDENSPFDIEVLEQPKKGLLGIGSKEAKIILRYTPSVEEVISEVIHALINEIPDSTFSLNSYIEGDIHFVEINGDNIGCLIGRHGAILKSIEFLLNRIAKISSNEHSINLDINGYWKSRTAFLYELSDKLAEKCVNYRKKIEFLPLPSHERKVIHVYLSKRNDLKVYSVGVGKTRHIVIEPLTNGNR
ncbi:RNA-binding cell elongation regulator Jag/EloR [Thermodesulfobium sp. 4217-1]|uniref:RNA-binding cell elongation regulator Jag/EloR n=1 Tax=Thermodesulfobium sp. 4217-1 TaxID=3120013 RepID=UPI003221EDA8